MSQQKTRKPRDGGGQGSTKQLWVNPRSNIKAENRWGESNLSPAAGERFLELADIALGLKKPRHPKKQAVPAANGAAHASRKIRPYSA